MRLLIAAALTAGLVSAQPKPSYEVYAIRYATLKDFSVAGLVAGADKSRKMDIAMMVWLVKGDGRNILVDCGFYRDRFMRQWHPADYERPSTSISAPASSPTTSPTSSSATFTGTTPTASIYFPRRKSGFRKKSSNTTPVKPGKATNAPPPIPKTCSAWSS